MRTFTLSGFRVPIAVLSVLSLALLAGCEGGSNAPSKFYYDYKEYLEESHAGLWRRAFLLIDKRGKWQLTLSHSSNSREGEPKQEKTSPEIVARCCQYLGRVSVGSAQARQHPVP